MSLTALEKIREIQSKAEQEIRGLRQQAVTEVVRKLSEAKSLVKTLEAEYSALTGKEPAGEGIKLPKTPKSDVSGTDQLADILNRVPGRRMSRKGFNRVGVSLKSALSVAKMTPKIFGFRQNGSQGEVWLK